MPKKKTERKVNKRTADLNWDFKTGTTASPDSPSNPKKKRRTGNAPTSAQGPPSTPPNHELAPPPLTGYSDTIHAANPFDDMPPSGPPSGNVPPGPGHPASMGHPQMNPMSIPYMNSMGMKGMPIGAHMSSPMGGAMSGPMPGPMSHSGMMGANGPGGPMGRGMNGPMGHMSGPPMNGPLGGPMGGPMSGPMPGSMNGPMNNGMNGPLSGPLNSSMNGPLSGPVSVPMNSGINSSPNGPMNGPGSSPMSGHINGPMSGLMGMNGMPCSMSMSSSMGSGGPCMSMPTSMNGPMPCSMSSAGPISNGPTNPNMGQKPMPVSSGKIYPADQPMVFNPQNPNAPPIYPCGHCHKEVHDNDQAILCESGCNFWFHRLCTGLSDMAYCYLINEVYAEWVCDKCRECKDIPLVKFKP